MQCSKTAPGADAPANRVSVSAARVKSVSDRFAPEKFAREQSARFKSLPERFFPPRSAFVKSGVTLGFLARQAFHSGERRSATCSGLGIRGGL